MITLQALRVVIADDQASIRKLIQRQLEKIGYKVLGKAMNGREAVELVQSLHPDIVLMDIEMPEMDGLEATRKIVNSHQASDRPKIIALTADAMSGDKEKCIEAGMDDYITKPVRLEEVLSTLKRWAPAPKMPVPTLILQTEAPNIEIAMKQYLKEAAHVYRFA